MDNWTVERRWGRCHLKGQVKSDVRCRNKITQEKETRSKWDKCSCCLSKSFWNPNRVKADRSGWSRIKGNCYWQRRKILSMSVRLEGGRRQNLVENPNISELEVIQKHLCNKIPWVLCIREKMHSHSASDSTILQDPSGTVICKLVGQVVTMCTPFDSKRKGSF